jgi:hypothetical protein
VLAQWRGLSFLISSPSRKFKISLNKNYPI